MPVRFVAGRLVTCDEGSPEYTQALVVSTLRCAPGDRMAAPLFGTTDQTFGMSTVDPVDAMLAQVQQWVPDADTADIHAAVTRVGG